MANNPFEDLSNQLIELKQLVKQLLTQQPVLQTDRDEIGSVRLAMHVTGLSKQTVYTKACKNQIPHFKKGGRLYFSKKALLDWITQGTRGSPAEQFNPSQLFPRQKIKYSNNNIK